MGNKKNHAGVGKGVEPGSEAVEAILIGDVSGGVWPAQMVVGAAGCHASPGCPF